MFCGLSCKHSSTACISCKNKYAYAESSYLCCLKDNKNPELLVACIKAPKHFKFRNGVLQTARKVIVKGYYKCNALLNDHPKCSHTEFIVHNKNTCLEYTITGQPIYTTEDGRSSNYYENVHGASEKPLLISLMAITAILFPDI